MAYKIYSYQHIIVQAMSGANIGQGTGSEVLYKQVTPTHYSYESFFFVSFLRSYKRDPWLATISNIILPTKNTNLKWARVAYLSFFMNIKTIPTNKWSCPSRDSDEQWACDTSSIDRG